MIGVFRGYNGRPTAVIVHDLSTYQHNYDSIQNYDDLEEFMKRSKVVVYKELCQW